MALAAAEPVLTPRRSVMSNVLRLPSPSDKCLAGTFQPSPAEQIREGESRVVLPFARQENQGREDRLRFLEADIHIPAEASKPAQRSPRVALRCLVSQEEAELERFGQADVLELA